MNASGGIRCLFLLAALSLFSGPTASLGGDFGHCQSARVIVARLADVNPDSLTASARDLLFCLDHSVDGIVFGRFPFRLPSWQLLRNIRRSYSRLGANPEVVAALERMAAAKDSQIKLRAFRALALYGSKSKCDTLLGYVGGFQDDNWEQIKVAMILAVAGDERGVELAISLWDNRPEDTMDIWNGRLLDALYYHSTPGAVAFIEKVAETGRGSVIRRRARWMLQNPMSVAASWKL